MKSDPTASDASCAGRTAQVCFLDHPFGPYSYGIPSDYGEAECGTRVRVPFGRRTRIGVLTEVSSGENGEKLKPLGPAVDKVRVVPDDLLRLSEWIADYYLSSRGEALSLMVPPRLKPATFVGYRLTKAGRAEAWLMDGSTPTGRLWHELASGVKTAAQLTRRVPGAAPLLEKFKRRGWIETVDTGGSRREVMDVVWRWTHLVTYDEALASVRQNAQRQREAILLCAAMNGLVNQSDPGVAGRGLGQIFGSLQKRGWLTRELIARSRLGAAQEGLAETAVRGVELTVTQREVLKEVQEAVANRDAQPMLLHGVTGSGKTLVYLEAAAYAVQSGRGVIILAPEISLTPQLVGRFRRRLGQVVAVTHSALGSTERQTVWREALAGRVRVVIGPRSAVFAPVQDLGLIIVDEEHEESYKQSGTSPRYNGRDVAIMRARMTGAAVLLGSATPDVTSAYKANTGRWRRLEMSERYGGLTLPPVSFVRWGISREGTVLSPELQAQTEAALQARQQAILLVNRRGFASCARCQSCGAAVRCPNCDITLRYHRVGHVLRCHYCGWDESAPESCPKCGRGILLFFGLGTQRLEKELKLQFPSASVARMDRDTTRRAGSHQQILGDFGTGLIDILIGTQMVAKGHDFPRVALVGILAADFEWLTPDYLAVERAFRLLVQASGRTGRAGEGKVLIQTWEPDAPVLEWVKGHNYQGLYDSEIAGRAPLKYPPFTRLASVMLSAPDQDVVQIAGKEFRQALVEASFSSPVLGPAIPPIERLERLYRRRLLVKFPPRVTQAVRRDKRILADTATDLQKKHRAGELRAVIDVDPIDV